MKNKCILCGKTVDYDVRDGYGVCPICGTYAYFDENGIITGYGNEQPSKTVEESAVTDTPAENRSYFENVKPITEEVTRDKSVILRPVLYAVCVISIVISLFSISLTGIIHTSKSTTKSEIDRIISMISEGSLEEAYTALLKMEKTDTVNALLRRFSYVPSTSTNGNTTVYRSYNSQGLIELESTTTSYSNRTNEFYYDSKGVLKEQISYSQQGINEDRTLYHYDSQDNLIAAISYRNGNVTKELIYAYENGRLTEYTERTIYNSASARDKVTSYSYDTDGNLIKLEIASQGTVSQAFLYTYKNGLLSSEREVAFAYINGSFQEYTLSQIKYEYDDHGRLVSEDFGSHTAYYYYLPDGQIAKIYYEISTTEKNNYTLFYNYSKTGELLSVTKRLSGSSEIETVESYKDYVLIFDYYMQ